MSTHNPLPILRWLCAATLAYAFAASSLTSARAATGLTEIPATTRNGPVTVFYPSSSAATQVQREPFTLSVADQGTPVRGNGRLIVLSHGTGGNPWVMSDLAQSLVGAGFVVAIPLHAGDNWHDTSKVGPSSWKLRPLEISNAIDSIAHDARFAPLVDINQVGMFGFSAGGHTALTLAGGRWSPARQLSHCEAHIADDFVACTGGATTLTGGWLDGPKKSIALAIIRYKLGDAQSYGHTDSRITAIVAAMPWAADFDLSSLGTPGVALGLVEAGQDIWLRPQWHVAAVRAACKTCVLVADLPGASHGAMLAPFPPLLSSRLLPLVADPVGFDRTTEVPRLNQSISAFFEQQLHASPKP